MNKHFEPKALQDKLKQIQFRQEYVLDSVNDTYRLVYYHYPTEPERDTFTFFGVPHGEPPFPEPLFSEKTLSIVLEKIKAYYPLMKAEDWEKYQDLSKKAVEATRMRCVSNNDITRKKEDDTVKKLCDFCKKHGLQP